MAIYSMSSVWWRCKNISIILRRRDVDTVTEVSIVWTFKRKSALNVKGVVAKPNILYSKHSADRTWEKWKEMTSNASNQNMWLSGWELTEIRDGPREVTQACEIQYKSSRSRVRERWNKTIKWDVIRSNKIHIVLAYFLQIQEKRLALCTPLNPSLTSWVLWGITFFFV